MTTSRSYAWFVVTYASPSEFKPLLDSSLHWCYALHDKDWKIDEDGNKVPKGDHYHILLAFEDEQSLKQIRERVKSEQNTLGQAVRNKTKDDTESVRGAWLYLSHEGQDPSEKFIYDRSIIVSDDIYYWEKRCNRELLMNAKEDSFYEDLLSDDFNLKDMGRKYGRDFMRNMNRYLEYRQQTLAEQEYLHNKELWKEIEQFCVENMISWEEARKSLYYISVELHARREADKLFNQKTGY